MRENKKLRTWLLDAKRRGELAADVLRRLDAVKPRARTPGHKGGR